ncbi:MAG: hypothetical protein AAGI38_14570 [Bacteroidota bacterium]
MKIAGMMSFVLIVAGIFLIFSGYGQGSEGTEMITSSTGNTVEVINNLSYNLNWKVFIGSIFFVLGAVAGIASAGMSTVDRVLGARRI